MSDDAHIIECYSCHRRATAPPELAGGKGAPSGENMPTMYVPAGWLEEPQDSDGRLLCGECASDEEIVEYMTTSEETEAVVVGQSEREITRREPTAAEAAADERAELAFGVEPVDPNDYGTLA